MSSELDGLITERGMLLVVARLQEVPNVTLTPTPSSFDRGRDILLCFESSPAGTQYVAVQIKSTRSASLLLTKNRRLRAVPYRQLKNDLSGSTLPLLFFVVDVVADQVFWAWPAGAGQYSSTKLVLNSWDTATFAQSLPDGINVATPRIPPGEALVQRQNRGAVDRGLLGEALDRVIRDLEFQALYVHPCEALVAIRHRKQWLDELADQLDGGYYATSPAVPVRYPRPGWTWRPAHYLRFADHCIYTYLGLKIAELVDHDLQWSRGTVCFSHQPASQAGRWFVPGFKGWRNWERVTLGKLREDVWLVDVDISHFYENLDPVRIVLAMEAAGLSESESSLLRSMLERWAGPRRLGIPQAHSTSHIIAEYELAALDRQLASEGFVHIRYVDDYRIFCQSEDEARERMQRFSELLRAQGLNLQDAKTQLRRAEEVTAELLGVRGPLIGLAHQIGEILTSDQIAGDYLSPHEVSEMAASSSPESRVEVISTLMTALMSAFAQTTHAPDYRLGRYALGQLAALRDISAVDFATELLSGHPHEFASVLHYLAQVRDLLASQDLDRIAKILTSGNRSIAYLQYAVLKWFLDHGIRHDVVLRAARQLILEHEHPASSHAIIYVAKWNEGRHDIDQLLELLAREGAELRRLTLAYALSKYAEAESRQVRNTLPTTPSLLRWAASSFDDE